MSDTVLLTKSEDIQNRLEELLKKETERSVQLKKRMEELSEQLSQRNVAATGLTEVKFGEDVQLRVGNGKFNIVVKSKATFGDVISRVNTSLKGATDIGYRDDQGRVVWLRTDQDIYFMFTWYFAQELPFIQIVAIDKQDIEPITKFDLRKEKQSKGMATFRCEAAGPERPLMFLVVQSNINKEDGFRYLESIFGSISSLMVVDEVEDIITIDSVESWDYCLETGLAMSKVGKFPLLLVQTDK